MAIEKMKRVESEQGEAGAQYFEYIELTAGVSNTYLLPVGAVYAVGVELENCKIYFTIDDEEMIRDEVATWIVWDGESKINLAITAFYVEWLSGSAWASVMVKTERI